MSARQRDMVVSLNYYVKAPFAVTGTIGAINVAYPK